jgi:hypothetical protein
MSDTKQTWSEMTESMTSDELLDAMSAIPPVDGEEELREFLRFRREIAQEVK